MITPSLRPLLLFVLLVTGRAGSSAEKGHELASLERSLWLHASLAAKTQKGYWGTAFPTSSSPTETDIRNAAKLLTDTYAANRLYLVYHHENPLQEAEQVFRWWRQYCPEKVQLVPTLVLRMYDQQQTPVFTPDELRQLVEFFQRSINAEQLAVYDVYPKRDQGDALRLLAEEYPKGLMRVGIQPDESIEAGNGAWHVYRGRMGNVARPPHGQVSDRSFDFSSRARRATPHFPDRGEQLFPCLASTIAIIVPRTVSPS